MNSGEKAPKIINLIKYILIFIFICILFYSVLLLSSQSNTNLIANPSFENGIMKPLNWTFATKDGSYPVWDNLNHSGTKSIKISVLDKIEMESAYLKSDMIKVKPQQHFIFSAWGKTDNLSETMLPAVRVVELDVNKKGIKQINLLFNKGTNDWVQKRIDFQTDLNTTYIYIEIDIWKGYGTFWVDDVVLKIESKKNSTSDAVKDSSITYYVDINGNDNNSGTESQPWRTIAKAASILEAGDTVLVKNGTYNEQVWVQNSGNAENWIVYAVYPGDTVVIDGTGISMVINSNGDKWNGLFNIHGKSYIKVTGFRFYNSDYAGFFVTKDYVSEIPSSNIIFNNNYIEKTWAAAIIMLGEASIPANNFIVDGNTLVQSHFSEDPRAMEGITLGHNLVNFEIKNNIIFDSSTGIIDVKSGVSNGKIYRNICVNSTYSCIYVDGWTDGASNIDIFENVVHDMISKNVDDIVSGFNVASEQGGLVENIRFHNNTAYNNSGTALMIASYSIGPVKNITITNNTFYNNGIGYKYRGGIAIDYDKATGIIVRNNIVSQNNEFQIWSSNSDSLIDHNLIYGYRGYYFAETRGKNYIEEKPDLP